RADRWRLFHDVGEPPYDNTPLGAWQPFGRISRTSCEVSVRKHETCTRHIKTYSHWTAQIGLGPAGDWTVHAAELIAIQQAVELIKEAVDNKPHLAAYHKVFAIVSH